MSALVAAIIPKTSHKQVIEACEASLNRRVEMSRESSGTKNQKKTGQAVSSETVEYATKSDVVTMFIELCEHEVGTIDRMVAKSAKLGLTGAKLEKLPASYKGADIAGWIAKMAEKPAKPAKSKPATPAQGATSAPKTESAPVSA